MLQGRAGLRRGLCYGVQGGNEADRIERNAAPFDARIVYPGLLNLRTGMWKASKRPCPLRQLRRDVSRMRGGLQESSAEPVRAYLPATGAKQQLYAALGLSLRALVSFLSSMSRFNRER